MNRYLAMAVLALLAGRVLSQTNWVGGMAPNWDQPYDYPDAYDATGPGPDPNPNGPSPWDAWCTPTAAAMLIGHWEDVRGWNGLADGFADGNQGNVPPGYGGPLWNNALNPFLWHDRTADGSQLRGFRAVNDIGWYMDTNNLGAPMGNGLHAGTYYKDAAPGLNNLFAAIGLPAQGLISQTFGVNAAFGGWNVNQLFAQIKANVDGNRVVIAHFSHWNIVGPPGPGQGNAGNQGENDFGFSDYTWAGTSQGGLHGEEWNGQTGAEGLGHSVAVVGYTMANGVVTHVIVHDNTPLTIRNVRVAAGQQLVAITEVVPEPASLMAFGVGLAALCMRRAVRKRS